MERLINFSYDQIDGAKEPSVYLTIKRDGNELYMPMDFILDCISFGKALGFSEKNLYTAMKNEVKVHDI